MNYMSKQEVFDRVATHLLAQGQPSFTRSGGALCAYRGYDGSMCAAGRLIKDEFYQPAFEGRRVTDERVEYALRASGVNMGDHYIMAMVIDLQMLHDGARPSQWRDGLKSIADQHNVRFDAPAKLPSLRGLSEPAWRIPVPVDISNLWVDESTTICDIHMPATALVTDRKPTHQLVPPDVTVKQWIANMPALDVGPEQASQPAPSVAHKQGVTA